eukprot:g19511.t1
MGNADSCCASSAGNEKPEVTVATPTPSEELEEKQQEKSGPDVEENPPRLVLRFILPDGTSKDCTFTERPLGIDFSRNLPLTAKRLKPERQGEKNEVKIGSCVSHINGVAVPANFDEALRQLQYEVSFLPAT